MCISLGGVPQFPQFTCRHHDGIISKAHPFLAIQSADEHRMIYSFSNTTSYSTFYALFSSFRITLWPIWLANSKRQHSFLATIVSRTRRHAELTNLMGNLICAREHSVQFFVQFFYTVKLPSLT